jgi:hypothetical protein
MTSGSSPSFVSHSLSPPQISQITAHRCQESSEVTERENYWHSHQSKYSLLLDHSGQFTPDKVAAKLRADMMTKMLLREAAAKFVDKPKVCFRFLQEHGV